MQRGIRWTPSKVNLFLAAVALGMGVGCLVLGGAERGMVAAALALDVFAATMLFGLVRRLASHRLTYNRRDLHIDLAMSGALGAALLAAMRLVGG